MRWGQAQKDTSVTPGPPLDPEFFFLDYGMLQFKAAYPTMTHSKTGMPKTHLSERAAHLPTYHPYSLIIHPRLGFGSLLRSSLRFTVAEPLRHSHLTPNFPPSQSIHCGALATNIFSSVSSPRSSLQLFLSCPVALSVALFTSSSSFLSPLGSDTRIAARSLDFAAFPSVGWSIDVVGLVWDPGLW